jgi:pyruvate/2-oxoglutarate dehydrogenase complex dihydrolipoamide acyltransferase (E2) component
MSRTQRLTFLAVAVVIAIVAVVLLTSSGGDDEQAANTGATATATATPTAGADATPAETPAPTATPRPQPPLLQPGKVTDLRFKQGQTVRFRVTADVTDHVHVHGYDLMKDIEPGKTIAFSFPATITGIFEIELEDAGEQIGQLRVDPA